jgi:hypothetical protein
MPSQLSSIDFAAYDREGRVLLLAEAKSRRGTSESWAAGLRRNMLSHGILPSSKYFLIATPERMYLWKQGFHTADAPPEFTIDAEKVFRPYFQKLHQEPLNIGPEAFELVVLTWLTDITRSGDPDLSQGPPSAGLSELTGSLQKARVEMHPMQ